MVAINRSSPFVTLLFQIFGCRSSSGIRKPWPVDKVRSRNQLHNRLTAEDEKQLLGLLVIVAHLGGAGRHALLNNTEIGVRHQVPAVAARSQT